MRAELVAPLLLLACTKTATPVSPRVLMERDAAFSSAVAARGAAGFREFVGSSVVTMPPGGSFQTTRECPSATLRHTIE